MQHIYTILDDGTVVRRRYLILRLLDKGDWGATYLVKDLYLKRNISNLFVLEEVVISSKQEQNRIVLGAMLLKRLQHMSLPRVYHVFGNDRNDRVYILTEYIDGPNLEILRLQQQKKVFSFSETLSIMAPVVDAITYLHKQYPPIIHENIHPTNIIVSKASEKAVLVNFGLFKQCNSSSSPAGAIRHCSIGYSAPEQYEGKTNTRTDIYALGATFYTLLTGTVPSDSLHRLERLGEKGLDPLVPVNQIVPGAPLTVANTIHRAMSISSNRRFSTVEQFWHALTTYSKTQQLPLLQVTAKDYKALNGYPVMQQRASPIVPLNPSEASRQAAVEPTPISVPKPPHIPQVSRRSVLLLVSLILLLVLSIGVGTGVYTVSHHSTGLATPTAVVLHKVTPPANAKPTMTSVAQPTVEPTPIPSPTPTPVPGGLVNLASSYSGTIYDVAAGFTTKMTLTQIQESQGRITGYFNGLRVNGTFQGSVDASRHIQLTVTDATGRIVLSFNGVVRLDNNVVGDYCNTDARGKCTGDSGLWSVSP